MTRQARIDRSTKETQIQLSLDLDGGERRIETGVGFFDHMLDHLTRHGGLGLDLAVTGDTHVDGHHTVEDTAIALGQALQRALGEKRGIERYGFASVPMDETLARASLDLSGRAYLVFQAAFTSFGEESAKAGRFDVQLVEEFFRAFSSHGAFNLHVEVPWGENNHHIAEGIFKATGRALRQAIAVTGQDVPSTKGTL